MDTHTTDWKIMNDHDVLAIRPEYLRLWEAAGKRDLTEKEQEKLDHFSYLLEQYRSMEGKLRVERIPLMGGGKVVMTSLVVNGYCLQTMWHNGFNAKLAKYLQENAEEIHKLNLERRPELFFGTPCTYAPIIYRGIKNENAD